MGRLILDKEHLNLMFDKKNVNCFNNQLLNEYIFDEPIKFSVGTALSVKKLMGFLTIKNYPKEYMLRKDSPIFIPDKLNVPNYREIERNIIIEKFMKKPELTSKLTGKIINGEISRVESYIVKRVPSNGTQIAKAIKENKNLVDILNSYIKYINVKMSDGIIHDYNNLFLRFVHEKIR